MGKAACVGLNESQANVIWSHAAYPPRQGEDFDFLSRSDRRGRQADSLNKSQGSQEGPAPRFDHSKPAKGALSAPDQRHQNLNTLYRVEKSAVSGTTPGPSAAI